MNIKQIHDIHMGVSYNIDHYIYKYVEHTINKMSSFKFDRKIIVSINQFKQCDLSIQIINNIIDLKNIMNIFSNDQTQIIEDISKSCTKQHIFNLVKSDLYEYVTPDTTMTIMHNFINNVYALIDHFFNLDDNILCRVSWIINIYSQIINKLTTKDNEMSIKDADNEVIFIVSSLYVLSLFEWFHLTIVSHQITKKMDKLCFLALGEITNIDIISLAKYTLSDLQEFLTENYCSHSVVLLITDKIMYSYDPNGYDNNDNNCYNRICKVINKPHATPHNRLVAQRVVPLTFGLMNITRDLKLSNPVQNITDDQYCIFHCFDFMINIVLFMNDVNMEYDIITKLFLFLKQLDERNIGMTIDHVYSFIEKLDKQANLFIATDNN